MSNPKIDRQTTTPFLLKLFYRSGTFHRLDEFSPNVPHLPHHLQIYTWPTCTLRELTHLLTSALPSLLPTPSVGTRIAFRLVYPDTRPISNPPSSNLPGRFLGKDLGSVVISAESASHTNGATEEQDGVGQGALASLEGEVDKTLADSKFVIGDYVSCAVFPPLRDGSIAPAPSSSTASMRGGHAGGPPSMPSMRGSYGGMRENGYGGGAGGGARGGRGYGSTADFPRVPNGEWRRGERVPDGPSAYGGSYGRPRGRGRPW